MISSESQHLDTGITYQL